MHVSEKDFIMDQSNWMTSTSQAGNIYKSLCEKKYIYNLLQQLIHSVRCGMDSVLFLDCR